MIKIDVLESILHDRKRLLDLIAYIAETISPVNAPVAFLLNTSEQFELRPHWVDSESFVPYENSGHWVLDQNNNWFLRIDHYEKQLIIEYRYPSEKLEPVFKGMETWLNYYCARKVAWEVFQENREKLKRE